MDHNRPPACELRERDGVSYLHGTLTFEAYPSMRSAVDGILRHGAARHVLDLGALTHIDSAGLGMLMIASEEMRRANRTLVVRAAAGQVRRVLDVTRMSLVMTIED